MKWIAVILVLFQIQATTPADKNAAQAIKEGNRLYKEGQWAAAAAEYEKAVNSSHRNIALVNKGNALYRQKKYEDAVKTYKQAASPANTDLFLRSSAYYNTGVVYSNQKKTEESIEEYKNALRLNWRDKHARENLQKALLELKEQSGGGGGGGEDKDESPKPAKSNLSQSQAQKQLDRLEEKEKGTQEKVTNKKGQFGGSAGKDW